MNIWHGALILTATWLCGFSVFLLFVRWLNRSVLQFIERLPDQIIIAEIEYR